VHAASYGGDFVSVYLTVTG